MDDSLQKTFSEKELEINPQIHIEKFKNPYTFRQYIVNETWWYFKDFVFFKFCFEEWFLFFSWQNTHVDNSLI